MWDSQVREVGDSNTSLVIRSWIYEYVGNSQQYLGYIRSNVQFWGPGYVEPHKVVREYAEHTDTQSKIPILTGQMEKPRTKGKDIVVRFGREAIILFILLVQD